MSIFFLKSSRRLFTKVAPIVVGGFSLQALAFQPLITDDTGTQGAGGNQLEFYFNEDRATAAGDTVRVQTLPLVYTHGLTETIDVYAGIGFTRIRSSIPGFDSSGYGNSALGAKWRFYEDEAHGTSFAIKPEIFFPVSARREFYGLGTGKLSGNLTLILTQQVAFGAVHANLGVGRDRFRDTLNNPDATTTRASMAPVWDVTEQWKLALDVGTESTRGAGANLRSNFVELCTIYSPNKDLDFDFGVVRRADNDIPKTTTHSASIGMTWRFK
ncbi:MAG: transporter [Propionivibrio sp.]|nr:transporter [Propionivibrio sp.]